MSNTATLLEDITDEGKFEELVNAVLRTAETDYKGIIGTGCNTQGKTVKSPIDGLYYVPNCSPPKVIIIHHTTCLRKDLEKKWLYDNALKKRPTKTPDGDVVKAIKWIEDEHKVGSDLQVTLVLTSNRIPSELLIRNTKQICIEHQIEVDFWDNSRISCYLNNNPEGQWLRKTYLGIEQERLSVELLKDISKQSLEEYESSLFVKCKSTFVKRKLDVDLIKKIENTNSMLTFLVAESGFGKSIASLRLLEKHINDGGYGIRIPHDMISSDCLRFDSVVDNTLRSFSPLLEIGSSDRIKDIIGDKHFLVVVDDINKSKDTENLLKKMISWLCNNPKSYNASSTRMFPRIHVICPVWPHNLKKIDDIIKKVEVSFVSGKSFEPDEAIATIQLALQFNNQLRW